jgi:predicted transcriptional regulator
MMVMEQIDAAKVPVCISVARDQLARLDAAAAAIERPRSWVCAKAIEQYLARNAAP